MNKNANRVIGQYFIRVIKDNNLYGKFKKNFINGYNFMVSERKIERDVEDIQSVDQFFDMVGNDRIKIHEFQNNNNKFDLITNIINKYLHYFIETAGVNPFKLGKFGQEIFDLSCNKLFGPSYVDELPKLEASIPQPRNEKEMFLISKYIHYINEENGDLEFADFIMDYDMKHGSNFYRVFYDDK